MNLFVFDAKGLSKSGVLQMVERFLDKGILERSLNASGQFSYTLSDPFFERYVMQYHVM